MIRILASIFTVSVLVLPGTALAVEPLCTPAAGEEGAVRICYGDVITSAGGGVFRLPGCRSAAGASDLATLGVWPPRSLLQRRVGAHCGQFGSGGIV